MTGSSGYIIGADIHNLRTAKEVSWLHGVWNSFQWLTDQTGGMDVTTEAQRLDEFQMWNEPQGYAKTFQKQVHTTYMRTCGD